MALAWLSVSLSSLGKQWYRSTSLMHTDFRQFAFGLFMFLTLVCSNPLPAARFVDKAALIDYVDGELRVHELSEVNWLY